MLQLDNYTCFGSPATFSSTLEDNDSTKFYWYKGTDISTTPDATTKSWTTDPLTSESWFFVQAQKKYNTATCKRDTTFRVQVLQLPNISIEEGNNIAACEDGEVTLHAKNGDKYAWDTKDVSLTNENNGTLTFKPTRNGEKHTLLGGKYYEYDNKTYTCYNTDSTSVTLYELPSFTIEGPTDTCQKQRIALTGKSTENLTYMWTDTLGNKISTLKSHTFLIASDTTVRLTAYNALGCSSSKTHSVKMHKYPILQLDEITSNVCKNDKAKISVSNTETEVDNIQFEWTSWGETGVDLTKNFIEPTVPKQTQYTVTAYNVYQGGKCPTVEKYTVNTWDDPTIIVENVSVCPGEKATLVATSPTISDDNAFTWEGSFQGATYETDSIKAPKTFTVTAVDGNNCKGKTTVSVSLHPLPSFSLSSDGPVCRGTYITVEADNMGLEYDWHDMKGFHQDMTYSEILDNNKVIHVTARTAYGCTKEDSIPVSVKDNPVLSLTMKNSEGKDTNYVCYGEEMRLTAGGANGGYYWTVDGKDKTDNNGKSELVLSQLTIPANVTLRGISNGCESTIDTTINIWSLPNITIEAQYADVCIRSYDSLYAKGGISGKYTWSGPDITGNDVRWTGTSASTLSGDNVKIYLDAQNNASFFAKYRVIGVDENGCKGTGDIDVKVNELPTVHIEGEKEVCQGSEASLYTSGTAESFEWSVNGQTYYTPSINPEIKTNGTAVYLIGTDNNDCKSADMVKINTKPIPHILVNTNTGVDTVCKNDKVRIDLKAVDVNGNDLSDDATWEWQNNNTNSYWEEVISNKKNYNVRVEVNKCQNDTTFGINVWPLPIFEIKGDDAICIGKGTELIAEDDKNGNGPLTYLWTETAQGGLGKTDTIKNHTTADLSITPKGTTKYAAEGTDKHLCRSTATHIVRVDSLPTDLIIVASPSDHICEGENVTLKVTGSGVDYTWSIDGNNLTSGEELTYKIEKTTIFTVSGRNANGCDWKIDKTIYMKERPVIEVVEKPDYVCYNTEAKITVKGAETYKWDNNETSATTSEILQMDRTFRVTGSKNGCEADPIIIPVPVKSLPTILISSDKLDNEICLNDKISLIATGGKSGLYKWENNENSDTITVSPQDTTTYTVWGEDEYGCKNSNDYTVIVHPLPKLHIDAYTDLICEGDIDTLWVVNDNPKAANGSQVLFKSYAWGDGETVEKIYSGIKTDKTFKVTVQDIYGCVNEAEKLINTKPYPKLNVTAPDYVCYNERGTVSITGAQNYTWNDGSHASQFSNVLHRDTVYSVVGETNGCQTDTTFSVAVMPLPNIWISSNLDELCLNQSITMRANGGSTYVWNVRDIETNSSTVETVTVKPNKADQTFQYRVTGTDLNGCVNRDTFEVKVNPAPKFNISGNKEICQGDIDTLWVTGNAIKYTWTNTGEQSDTIHPIVEQATTYRVIAESENGCTSEDSIKVKVKPYPTITINAPTAVCHGEKAILTASGANEYVWGGNPANNNKKFADTPEKGTTYTVKGTTKGCTSEASVYVDVNPLPYVWITGNESVCSGSEMVLSANGASSYVWSTRQVGEHISLTPTETSRPLVISVTGTDANNCVNRDTFTITVHPLPDVKIKGDNATCNGDATHLEAVGAKDYVWNTSEQGAHIYPIITANKTFTVEGTDEYGCKNSATKTVTRKFYPILSYTAPSAVCDGSEVRISVTGASRYTWSGTESLKAQGGTMTDTIRERTIYQVTGEENGCTTVREIIIDKYELPTIWINGPATVCQGSQLKLSATGGNTYTWAWGNNTYRNSTLSDQPERTMTYHVTGTDSHKCSNTAEHEVVVKPNPKFVVKGETEVCEGTATTLTAEPTDNSQLSFSWSNGAGTPSITPVINTTTKFIVVAKDANNCESTVTHTVVSQKIPEVTWTGTTTICQGDRLQLNAKGAKTYQWTCSEKPGVTLSTTNLMTDYPTTSAIYVLVGSSNGCSAEPISIPVNALPNPNLTYQGNTIICENSQLTLTVYGADSYLWNNGSSNKTMITIPPAGDTTFSVIGTDKNKCKSELKIPVKVNKNPEFTIEGETEVCRGEYTTLTATGEAMTYYWGYQTPIYDKNLSGNGAPIAVQIDIPTYVFVKGVDQRGCETEKSITIKMKNPPYVKYSGDTKVCLGETIELLAEGDAKEYTWSTDGGITSRKGNPYLFQPTGVTRLLLSGIADNGCVTTEEIYIETNVAPNVDIYGDSIICEGGNARLIADGAEEFVWVEEKTGKIEQGRYVERSGMEAGPNKFYITGTSINNCKNTKEFTLWVHKNPEIHIHDTLIGCPSTGTVAEFSVNAPNISWCEWKSYPLNGDLYSNSEKKVSATITEPTQIYVVAYDNNRCASYDTIEVDALQFNPIQFDVTPTVIDENSNTIEMTGIYPATNNWTWLTDDDTEDWKGREVKHTFKNPSTRDSFLITARAVDDKGCLYEGDTIVYVWKDFWAPNAFSPNEDAMNDKFWFLGTEFMTEFHWRVFDRTGRIVFESDSREGKWDGRDLNGEECGWGVYGYIVEYKSIFKGINKTGERRGTVTLIR